MRKFCKRLLTMLLAAAMVLGLGGMTAFAAEADESGIVPLADDPWEDIIVYKNGYEVYRITEDAFNTAAALAPERTMTRTSGNVREVTAHFVKLTDLLDGFEPDTGCGALVDNNTSIPFTEEDGLYDNLYLYNESDTGYTIRTAVDEAAGRYWASGVKSITLGHYYDANGTCVICGASESSVDTYNVKYAVTLWGINQDRDKYGNPLGLTFGPATGEDHRNDYKAHMTEEEYESGENGVCLHWMSWEEIAEQSSIDPKVFATCLEEGCTHSVNLTLNTDLLATTYVGTMNYGDGASVLNDSIAADYRQYNASNDATGGWPASQIRAVLNGKDKQTRSDAEHALDVDDCLLSCFPSELQGAIVRRAVTSDTVFDSEEESDSKTTYDKLWLPSGREVYEAGSSNNEVIRKNEGTVSKRSSLLGITTTDAAALTGFDEKGEAVNWRLRSLSQLASNYVYLTGSTGSWLTGSANNMNVGLAPCFCLAGTDHNIDETFYDVKYAVSIWGINHDVDEEGNTLGLTFGPATGADYRSDYNAHLTEEEYDSGEYGVCLHWMSWDEIVKQSKTDPAVFEECMKNGCTHAVNLTLNDTLLDVTYADGMDDGDGVGYLYHSINSEYRQFNHLSTVGWPYSEARAVLNGEDDLLPSDRRDNIPEDSLLTCFPDILQDNIVAKEVKSDTSITNNNDEADIVTTYDKLWYFSAIEMWKPSESDDPYQDEYNNGFLRPLEGSLYERSEAMGVTTTSAGGLRAYNEEADTGHLWYTRTLNNDTQGTGVVAVLDSGIKQGYDPNSSNVGLAPGFCLSGPQPGDKTALEEKVAEVKEAMESLSPDDYTPGSWEALEEALANAQEVLDKEGAYQVEIDDALEELESAYNGLTATVDKTGLEAAIEEAKALDEDKDSYTEDSWEALQKALAVAEEVDGDVNATADAVKEATEDLLAAIDGLKPVEQQPAAVDKEVLEITINAAEDLIESDYTKDSWDALQNALAAAREVYADSDVTQSDVNTATIGLVDAIADLEGAYEEPGTEADKTDLKKMCEEALGLSKSNYTEESWKPFEEALFDAIAVLSDPNATQDAVETAEETLQTAMDNLKPAGEPDKGGNGGNVKNGLYMIDKGVRWGYYVNDKVDTSFTGFVHNDNGDWYVQNGYIIFADPSANGVFKDTAGGIGAKSTWYYVTGGKVQYGFTGLAHYKNQYGWWYITDGVVDFSHSGVDKNQNGWWYVKAGKVEFGHNGVDKNRYGWWYITGGKVRFDFTGLANYRNQNGWWYISGGKVDFSHNGVDKNKNGWWYVNGGKVNFNFTGIASNRYGTWYISGGKVRFDYNGTVTADGRTYSVRNGEVS